MQAWERRWDGCLAPRSFPAWEGRLSQCRESLLPPFTDPWRKAGGAGVRLLPLLPAQAPAPGARLPGLEGASLRRRHHPEFEAQDVFVGVRGWGKASPCPLPDPLWSLRERGQDRGQAGTCLPQVGRVMGLSVNTHMWVGGVCMYLDTFRLYLQG